MRTGRKIRRGRYSATDITVAKSMAPCYHQQRKNSRKYHQNIFFLKYFHQKEKACQKQCHILCSQCLCLSHRSSRNSRTQTQDKHTHAPPTLFLLHFFPSPAFRLSTHLPQKAYDPALYFPSLLCKYPYSPLRAFPTLTPLPSRTTSRNMAQPPSADTNPTSSPNPSPSVQPSLQQQSSSQPQNCKLRFLMVNGESFHMLVPASATVQHIKQKVINERPPGMFLPLLFACDNAPPPHNPPLRYLAALIVRFIMCTPPFSPVQASRTACSYKLQLARVCFFILGGKRGRRGGGGGRSRAF